MKKPKGSAASRFASFLVDCATAVFAAGFVFAIAHNNPALGALLGSGWLVLFSIVVVYAIFALLYNKTAKRFGWPENDTLFLLSILWPL